MIKILYLHAGSEMYGADKVLLQLLKGLDKEVFEPIVILPSDGVLAEKLRAEQVETYIIPYPILRRKHFSIRGIIYYIYSYIKYSKKIFEMVANKKISILHINTTAVLEGIYLKRKLNIPVIWHIHEIIMKPKIIFKILSFMIGRYADKIVVVSNVVGQHLFSSGFVQKNKVITIYNGVDNAVYNPLNDASYIRKELFIPEDAFVIGMLGRVNAWKGQADFLKAMEIVLAKCPNVYAVMVGGVFEGEQWRMDELNAKAKASSYHERIKVCDFRTDPENVHCMFDLFVLPSINPDPLPTVVLEAMASGRVVVGYRHGGICEMCIDGETGLLVDARNYVQLAKIVDALTVDESMLERMSLAAEKRQKEFFSLDNYIQSFEKIYIDSFKSCFQKG